MFPHDLQFLTSKLPQADPRKFGAGLILNWTGLLKR